MDTYVVDHNGSHRTNPDEKHPDGEVFHFSKGKPVKLPDDVVKALGDSAKKVGDNPAPEKTEDKEDKEAKGSVNRMMGKGQTETK